MSLCFLFRTAAKVSPLIATLYWFQLKPDLTNATFSVLTHQLHSETQLCITVFLSRIRYDQCVVGVFATFRWMVWSRVTVYFNRRQVNDFFRRCVNVLSPFVTLSSVFASMSSCYTQDANCWQQRRLSWWSYGKTLATPLLTARKRWRSLTMT